jgi:hypothetical protein
MRLRSDYLGCLPSRGQYMALHPSWGLKHRTKFHSKVTCGSLPYSIRYVLPALCFVVLLLEDVLQCCINCD